MKYQFLVEFKAESDSDAVRKAQAIHEACGVEQMSLERITEETYGDSLDGPGFGNRYVKTIPVSLR